MTPAELEGLVIGPVTHRVDRDRLRAFVDVTGDDPQRWTDHAPPGYAAALLFAVAADFLTDPRITPYLATLIHVDQQFSFLASITTGSDVVMTGTVQRVRERSGAYFVTFVADGTIDGRAVLESRSTFLMSDQVATDLPDEEPEPPFGLRGENRSGREPQSAAVGDVRTAEKSASRIDLVRYAAATGDFNPLHWDHETAIRAGLPGVVVHGLLMVAWMAQQAGSFGAGFAPVAMIKARFRSALRPAAQAQIEAMIGAVATDGRDADVRLGLAVGDEDVVTGSAVVRLEAVTP